jgi:hypothetical protein
MAFSANIIAKLKVGTDIYEIELAIPDGPPTKDAPYTFTVTQTPEGGGTGVEMLDLSVGNSTNYSLKLTPPPSILAETGVVEDLKISVASSD